MYLGGLVLTLSASGILAAQEPDHDTVGLETLTIEGKTLEFTKAQIEEIKTRIVAIGMQNPKSC